MKKVHYAWVICALGMLMMFCNMGLTSNILSVYLPFIEQNGITGTQGSMIISVRCISSFIGTFLVSKYYRVFSLRNGLTLATAIASAGMVLFAFAGNNIWIYYIGAAILGVGYAFGTLFAVTLLIKNWFRSSVGTALGLCSMGTGFATIIFSQFITANTLKHGLKSTCLWQALFVFIIAAITYILVRSTPEEIGKNPFAKENEPKFDAGTVAASTNDSFDIPQIAWIQMMVMLFLVGGVGQTSSSHLAITASTAGYTKEICGLCTTIYGVFLIVGKVSFGPLADKIGALRATVISMMVFYASCLSVLLMNGNSMLPIYMMPVFLGLGSPYMTVGVPLWAADLSPKDTFEKTLRWFQILYSGGGIIMTAIPGRIADVTGEYKSTYIMIGILMFIAMIILLHLYRNRINCYQKNK